MEKTLILIVILFLSVDCQEISTFNMVELTLDPLKVVSNIRVSPNGKKLILGYNNQIQVYINDGTNLQLLDSYSNPSYLQPHKLNVMSKDDNLFLGTTPSSVCVLEFSNSGITMKWSYDFPNLKQIILISPDFSYLFTKNTVDPQTFTVYRYDGLSLVQGQTFIYTGFLAGANLKQFSFSGDSKKFAYFTEENPTVLRIIRQNQFTHNFQIMNQISDPLMTMNSKIFHNGDMSIIGFCQGDIIKAFRADSTFTIYSAEITISPQPSRNINRCLFIEENSLIRLEYTNSGNYLEVFDYNYYSPHQLINFMQVSTIYDMYTSVQNTFILYQLSTKTVKFISKCPSECNMCDLQSNCLTSSSQSSLSPDYCLEYMSFPNQDICEITCHRKCLGCSAKPENCIECASPYIMNQQHECVLPLSLDLAASCFSALNILRSSKTKFFFLLIADLELYQYHNIKYKGTIRLVFDTSQMFEERAWVFFPPLQKWANSKFSSLPNYNAHSKEQNLINTRRDTILAQNTKAYFSIYIPMVIATFFIFNKVFYWTFNYPLSFVFRSYSFYLYLLELTIVNYLPTLWFFALRNMTTIFSQSLPSKALQMVNVLLFFTFAMAIPIYVLYQIMYKRLSLYFLPNMQRKNKSFYAATILYIIKPIALSCIHLFLFERQKTQLMVLGCIYGASFLLMAYYQLKWKIYKLKSIFAIQCLINLQMGWINFLLIMRYCSQSISSAQKQLWEYLIDISVYCLILLALVLILIGIIQSMRDLVRIVKKNCQNQEVSQSKQNKQNVIFQESQSEQYKGNKRSSRVKSQLSVKSYTQENQ